jgi:hypothetical protein
VDADHQLRLLGTGHAAVVDHTDAVFPAHDDAAAVAEGGDRVAAASDRAVGAFGLLVCFSLHVMQERERGFLIGVRIISLGKLAKRVFVVTHSLPHVEIAAGDVFYVLGFLSGLILWSFAIIWLVIAIVMMIVSGGFPFNMGWWGFIFPVGVYLLTTNIMLSLTRTSQAFSPSLRSASERNLSLISSRSFLV